MEDGDKGCKVSGKKWALNNGSDCLGLSFISCQTLPGLVQEAGDGALS